MGAGGGVLRPTGVGGGLLRTALSERRSFISLPMDLSSDSTLDNLVEESRLSLISLWAAGAGFFADLATSASRVLILDASCAILAS